VSEKETDVPIQQVTVPDIGGAEGAEVIELLVAVGDTVSQEQGLIVLESDKASMEIPSAAAGTVVELLVAVGDKLSEGAPIARIDVAATSGAASEQPAAGAAAATQAPAVDAPATADAAASEEAPAPAPRPAPGPASRPAQAAPPPAKPSTSAAMPAPGVDDAGPSSAVYAGPAVRKLAREFGVPLARVAGTGPQGRILKEDLQQFVQQSLRDAPPAGAASAAALPSVPEIDFAAFGDVEVTQRSRIDKLTAANMHRSWLNVPHVTQFDDADITDLEAFRAALKDEAQRRDTRLTPLPFILKACAVALREHPRLNASLARGGEDLVYKKYIHIGMAVDTPAGLVVPVIRDVDRKSIWELALETAALAAKARDRKLAPGDMQGGCFTVSSLGAIGGNGFTPIVNTPEVGILGVSKAAIKPVWNGSAFAPRTLLPLALSYDHRVVNGGDGGRFLTALVELLGDIRRLSL